MELRSHCPMVVCGQVHAGNFGFSIVSYTRVPQESLDLYTLTYAFLSNIPPTPSAALQHGVSKPAYEATLGASSGLPLCVNGEATTCRWVPLLGVDTAGWLDRDSQGLQCLVPSPTDLVLSRT